VRHHNPSVRPIHRNVRGGPSACRQAHCTGQCLTMLARWRRMVQCNGRVNSPVLRMHPALATAGPDESQLVGPRLVVPAEPDQEGPHGDPVALRQSCPLVKRGDMRASYGSRNSAAACRSEQLFVIASGAGGRGLHRQAIARLLMARGRPSWTASARAKVQ
jgi:hypothetical protein